MVRGVFDHGRETLVQAVTDYGAGFWVLTPLRTTQGFTVLVNRGFVTPERRAPETRSGAQVGGPQTVVGLLRVTEPGGGFLRANDPGAGRWYSRDVAAIGVGDRRILVQVPPEGPAGDHAEHAGCGERHGDEQIEASDPLARAAPVGGHGQAGNGGNDGGEEQQNGPAVSHR